MRIVNRVAFLLVIIGAINAGLWGFFLYDFIGEVLGGPYSTCARVAFAIIGLAGLVCLGCFCHRCCGKHQHKHK